MSDFDSDQWVWVAPEDVMTIRDLYGGEIVAYGFRLADPIRDEADLDPYAYCKRPSHVGGNGEPLCGDKLRGPCNGLPRPGSPGASIAPCGCEESP